MGLLDTIKDIALLVQKTDNIELVKHVLALQNQGLEMQQENQSLRERVKTAEDALAFAKTLTFQAPLYYAAEDVTPFCSRCWEIDRRAIHLKGDWNGRRWECYQCRTVYLLDDTAKPGVTFKAL